eukprot:GILK01008172.1.p1 GENE.GILK01008172.1~~GILK01008172.1.p1  ORF type:complete len:745 (-),score=168.98 GILK01008172.1:137-2371(-)
MEDSFYEEVGNDFLWNLATDDGLDLQQDDGVDVMSFDQPIPIEPERNSLKFKIKLNGLDSPSQLSKSSSPHLSAINSVASDTELDTLTSIPSCPLDFAILGPLPARTLLRKVANGSVSSIDSLSAEELNRLVHEVDQLAADLKLKHAAVSTQLELLSAWNDDMNEGSTTTSTIGGSAQLLTEPEATRRRGKGKRKQQNGEDVMSDEDAYGGKAGKVKVEPEDSYAIPEGGAKKKGIVNGVGASKKSQHAMVKKQKTSLQASGEEEVSESSHAEEDKPTQTTSANNAPAPAQGNPQAYWQYIDNYFRPITTQDLTVLEERPIDLKDPIYTTPDIVRYDIWGDEMLPTPKRHKGTPQKSTPGGGQRSKKQSADSYWDESPGWEGEILKLDHELFVTNRVVASFLETPDPHVQPVYSLSNVEPASDADLEMAPVIPLEDRIRLELITVGLLDSIEFDIESVREDDSLCIALRGHQEELTELIRHNNSMLNQLKQFVSGFIEQDATRISRNDLSRQLESTYKKKRKLLQRKKKKGKKKTTGTTTAATSSTSASSTALAAPSSATEPLPPVLPNVPGFYIANYVDPKPYPIYYSGAGPKRAWNWQQHVAETPVPVPLSRPTEDGTAEGEEDGDGEEEEGEEEDDEEEEAEVNNNVFYKRDLKSKLIRNSDSQTGSSSTSTSDPADLVDTKMESTLFRPRSSSDIADVTVLHNASWQRSPALTRSFSENDHKRMILSEPALAASLGVDVV